VKSPRSDPARSAMTHEQAGAADLRRALEPIVADRCGARNVIATIDRSRCDASSSYASDLVTVRLTGGEELRFFLKDFSASQYRKEEPQQRDRELRVYRDLLAGAGLGTATYDGCIWEESRGRYWLILDFVGWTPLTHCEFGYWRAAAGWLGRLHGYFAEHLDRLRPCAFLLRHDSDFFWSRARLALAAVSLLSSSLARRVEMLLKHYDQCVEIMASQPPTLVHGSYKPRHILVDVRTEPPRVCPVDWELAAAGSALYDLAFISAGFEPEWLERMLDAYRDEATAHNVRLPDRAEMRYVVACFHLHKILKSLGSVRERTAPESTAGRSIDQLERLSKLL
jgi:aminoglycoside phosphotransferase (APT) family kinase protein